MVASDWASFKTTLDTQRALVDAQFGKIFSNGDQTVAPASSWANLEDIDALSQLGFADPNAAAEQLKQFKNSQRYRSLPATSQARLDLLMPRMTKTIGYVTLNY